MKTHGDSGWESFPSYLPSLVPAILDLLDQVRLTITFFIVGQDAALDVNRDVLKEIADRGHEVGNHSFHHEPWLHLYTREQIVEEFQRSESAIEQATGVRTIGFRGPGFSYSDNVLSVLSERGYTYDCSTFPTFLGPLARMYYFLHSGLGRKERDKRNLLFGRWEAGFQRLRPYHWHFDTQHQRVKRTKAHRQMLEIPVTTMPWFKVPIHLSYVMYLATFSRSLAVSYFRNALRFCWLNRVEPSLLLHPLDFLGGDEEKDLSFFPGMNLSSATKRELGADLLGWMKKSFECVTMQAHAAARLAR
jgi:peptidoglycan-N-acetylglucosamine deacetylase